MKKQKSSWKKIIIITSGVVMLIGCILWLIIPRNVVPANIPDDASRAIFAGGCFWCVEADFEKLKGVYAGISGYTGGKEVDPTYQEVASNQTGHLEAVEIFYDPEIISYDQLIAHLLTHIDPTDGEGQFVDRGPQYAPAIFYADEQQKNIALKALKNIDQKEIFDLPTAVKVLPKTIFYPAEEYHQDYYLKNKFTYRAYRLNSGRDAFLRQHWQTETTPKAALELREKLSPIAYHVTQKEGTEPPFDNPYWDNKDPGIYVDVVSGEPLFSSRDKYDSKTGWPSFTQPLVSDNIREKKDYRFFISRTEIRSTLADSHLGHVFPDGPVDRGGLRYCINSAALRFIPLDELETEGYGEFVDQV